MITIHLYKVGFHAFHGLHEEEGILGNDFEVDCDATFHEQVDVVREIGDTINYVSLYEIIRERMETPTPLLETVAMEIGNSIYQIYPDLKSIRISIQKLHPPISGFRGSVGVTWYREY